MRLVFSFFILFVSYPTFANEFVPKPNHQYLFVGCRPSIGECFNSCPSHNSISVANKEVCDPFETGREIYACFCVFRQGSNQEDL